MWASKLRHQGRMKNKINSVHWLDGYCNRDFAANCAENDNEESCCGWMLFGGGNGELGVSWIGRRDSSCNCDKSTSETKSGSPLYKSHFMLRGHSAGVKFVRWSPLGDKLVSYDGWGNVRIWKIRSNIFASEYECSTVTPVTDIQWSPCGMYIAICGEEGQLQVISGHDGSIVFAIHAIATSSFGTYAEFTSLSWNSTSTRIALGTGKGEVIEVDPHQNGKFLMMMSMHEGVSVRHVEYFGSVEYFQEPDRRQGGDEVVEREPQDWIASQSLSLYMQDGEVAVFPTTAETQCYCVQTRIVGGLARWNKSQTILAVVGYRSTIGTPSYLMARFLNADANILMSVDPLMRPPLEPCNCYESSLTSICWGLQDSALFIAYGTNLVSVDVWQKVPSLSTLCRELVNSNVKREAMVMSLPLPQREIVALQSLRPTLLSLPFDVSLCDQTLVHQRLEKLFAPPLDNQRFHCILMTHFPSNGLPESCEQLSYTLKYEHFGSYIPLLKAFKKPARGFQRIGFDVTAGDMLMGGNGVNNPTHWAATPTSTAHHRQQRRRNSWSGTTNSKFDRLMKTMHRLRPQSSVLDASFDEEDQSGPPLHTDIQIDTPIDTPTTTGMSRSNADAEICPVIAEINGNRLMNKFKISRSIMQQESPSAVGEIKIYSHHIKCEPRDVEIRLYNGNEDDTVNLSSKKPEWNSRFNVYELDFGGRISRDSVKNLQVEMDGKIVLQFGRSIFNDYCLDFQAPFSPVTAMGVALAAIHSS